MVTALLLAGCGSSGGDSNSKVLQDQVDELESENADLRDEVDALEQQLDDAETQMTEVDATDAEAPPETAETEATVPSDTDVSTVDTEASPVETVDTAEPPSDTSGGVNPRGLFAGTAVPTLDPGEDGALSVVYIGPVPAGDAFGSTVIPVVVRNRTSEDLSDVEVSGGGRLDGTLVATGSSLYMVPAVLQPGEYGYAYLYFSDTVPAGVEFELSVDAEKVEDSYSSYVDISVTEANLIPGDYSDSIVGTLTNQTDATTEGFSVLAMCFNGGALTSAHSGNASGSQDVEPGGTITFSVDLYGDLPCETFLVGATGYQF